MGQVVAITGEELLPAAGEKLRQEISSLGGLKETQSEVGIMAGEEFIAGRGETKELARATGAVTMPPVGNPALPQEGVQVLAHAHGGDPQRGAELLYGHLAPFFEEP